jgi:hypothetical protein
MEERAEQIGQPNVRFAAYGNGKIQLCAPLSSKNDLELRDGRGDRIAPASGRPALTIGAIKKRGYCVFALCLSL